MFLVVFLGFFGLLLLAGTVILGLYAQRNMRSASLLQRPLCRVDELRPGCRKIRGKIAAIGKSLRSPVANRECVYYRLRVYEERSTFKEMPELPGGVFTALLTGGLLGARLYQVYEIDAGKSRTTYERREESLP